MFPKFRKVSLRESPQAALEVNQGKGSKISFYHPTFILVGAGGWIAGDAPAEEYDRGAVAWR